jgi:DNA-binding XRE family transcriptional regulator
MFSCFEIYYAYKYTLLQRVSKELEVTPKRIRAARIKLGLNLQDAAKRWGFSPHTLQSWENGRRKPAGLYLAKLKRILKRTIFCFCIVLNLGIIPLRAQSTALPSDVRGARHSCTLGSAGVITRPTTTDHLIILTLYGGLLVLCVFVPFAYYRKTWTGESRLDAKLVNMWRLTLLANGISLRMGSQTRADAGAPRRNGCHSEARWKSRSSPPRQMANWSSRQLQ